MKCYMVFNLTRFKPFDQKCSRVEIANWHWYVNNLHMKWKFEYVKQAMKRKSLFILRTSNLLITINAYWIMLIVRQYEFHVHLFATTWITIIHFIRVWKKTNVIQRHGQCKLAKLFWQAFRLSSHNWIQGANLDAWDHVIMQNSQKAKQFLTADILYL